EHKHRVSWSAVRRPKVRIGTGPYRTTEVEPPAPLQAPWLVRAASVGALYWSWFCTLAWVAVFAATSGLAEGELLALVGFLVALGTGRAGILMLRRDEHAPRSARRAAAWSLALAVLVLGSTSAAAASRGEAALDWLGPAIIFAFVTGAVAALLLAASHKHAGDFAAGHSRPRHGDELPGWLARVVTRRKLQRRANFVASASHTIPGA
ncbi:MAG TPA: hypothetical protein VE987_13290, partial [Polyangiaceae bacterium]|nr:hypothetical protein [Polyangiaceae bacterium]